METLSDAKANWHGQTSEPLWRLSWSKLRSERYCANITWKHFTVVLFTSFLPSLFDFGTDYLSGVNFLSGTNYTKYVNHGSDFGTCTHTGRYTSFVGPRPEVLYEEISCFEVDRIWGYLTIGITFLPGFRFAWWTRTETMRQKNYHLGNCLLILFLPLGPLFPLFVVMLKGVALFSTGSELKKLITEVTAMEGIWESTLQFLLSLFIIITRPDRRPSWIQLATLATSLAVIVKTAIAEFLFRRRPTTVSLASELRSTLSLVPLFLSNTFFKLGSIAVAASLLRYWALLIYPGLAIFLWATAVCSNKRNLISGNFHAMLGLVQVHRVTDRNMKDMWLLTEQQSMTNLIFSNILWLVINTLTVSSLVIANNMKVLQTGTDQVIFEENSLLLNTILALTLISGFSSAVLLFHQVWAPFKEKQNLLKTATSTENELEKTKDKQMEHLP